MFMSIAFEKSMEEKIEVFHSQPEEYMVRLASENWIVLDTVEAYKLYGALKKALGE